MSDVTIAIRYFFVMSMLNSVVPGLQDLEKAGHLQSSQSLNHSSHLNHDNGNSPLHSPWSEWEPCSRTCGTGITSRHRTCYSKYSNRRDESSCSESTEYTEYKTCKFTDCSGTQDFRSIQCSQYNNRLVAGQHAKSWIPTKTSSNPCELRCESKGTNLVYGFGKAENGTPCLQDGICLDGRCLEIGCDQRLGSGAKFDMCGVCNGQNGTCVHYKDAFYGQMSNTTPSDRRRHEEIVILPIGAMNFEMRNLARDNVLGMRDRTVAILFHSYRNAETLISGTVVKYSKEDSNQTDVLRLKGPTKTELYISVLLLARNPGIHYEYWLPKDPLKIRRVPLTKTVFSTTGVKLLSTSSSSITTPKPSRKTYITLPYISHPVKEIRGYGAHNPNLNNVVVYGPKRRVFIETKKTFLNFHKPSEKPSHPSTTTTVGDTFHQSVRLPNFKMNFKTPKPVFNYYEKYRNSSFYQPPLNIYRAISSDTYQNNGFASGTGKNDVESDIYKVKGQVKSTSSDAQEKEEQKDASFNGQFQLASGEKLSSRWEYSFHGDKKRDDPSSEGSHSPTPISIAVLPLPETGNYTKTRRGKRRGKNHSPRSTKGGHCEPCQRVRDQTKHFCSSNFVIRASILGYEFLHGETRYELEVLQSFKNNWGLLPREYIWSPDTCQCPRLRVGKEYLIMGKSDDSYRKNESRLVIDRFSFVRIYNSKFTRRLNRLKRDQVKKCSKIS